MNVALFHGRHQSNHLSCLRLNHLKCLILCLLNLLKHFSLCHKLLLFSVDASDLFLLHSELILHLLNIFQQSLNLLLSVLVNQLDFEAQVVEVIPFFQLFQLLSMLLATCFKILVVNLDGWDDVFCS